MKTIYNHDKANGTCLQGEVRATKYQLRHLFGKPLVEDMFPECKVMTEWIIEFEDGIVATIYDWKLDQRLGEYEEYSWHIGGRDGRVVARVQEILRHEKN